MKFRHLWSFLLIALLVVACVSASTDSAGVTSYKSGPTTVAMQAGDGPIQVTPEGVAAGYKVEPQADGSEVLVGPNPVEPFLPWLPAPLQPLVGVAGMIAARMTSKAGRKAAGNAVSSVAQKHFKDAGADLLSAIGVRADETDKLVAALDGLKGLEVSDLDFEGLKQMTLEQVMVELQKYHDETYGPQAAASAEPAA